MTENSIEKRVFVVVNLKTGLPMTHDWFLHRNDAYDWISEQSLPAETIKGFRVVPATLTYAMPKQ
jgi:hypothetical protein